MRGGCAAALGITLVVVGLTGGTVWIGFRLLQEPQVTAAQGTPEDGIRAQQKIFDIARAEPARRGGRPHQTSITEAELNRFLSKNLVEVARVPVVFGGVRLPGDGAVELKALLPLRDVLSSSLVSGLVPTPWLDRRVWLHVSATTSLEVGTTRSQRRYLRFDVQRLSIGRQPLPVTLLRVLSSPALQGLLRWRMPEAVEVITIEPGAVTIRTSS